MAEVTKIVDPGEGAGHDYHSLALWEAGEQGDLTSGARDGEIAVARCRATGGTADATALHINGWTTSSTEYIKIWTDPSELYRHAGVYSASKYRLEFAQTSASAITIEEDFVRIDGIQVYTTSNNQSLSGTFLLVDYQSAANDIRVSNCLFRGANNATYYQRTVYINDSDVNLTIWNSVFYNAGAHSTSMAVRVNPAATVKLYNNTFVGTAGYGIYVDSGDVTVINCIVKGYGNTQAYVGTFNGATDYNATDGTDVTGQGVHSHTGHTFTFVSESAGSEDYHLQATDAGAKGLSVPGLVGGLFTDDIDGQTRGGVTWDIGADEYVAAANTNIVRMIISNV